MEMHPDTISRTLFYVAGMLIPKISEDSFQGHINTLSPAQFISPYKFSFYRLILNPCANGTDPGSVPSVPDRNPAGSHFPFKGFLRKDFLFSAQTIILVHILDLCKLFIAQDIFFPRSGIPK